MKMIALVLVLIALPVAAQEVTRLPDGALQSVSFEAGLQSAFVARATYSRHFGAGTLYARFSLPFAAPDLNDLAFEAGGEGTVIAHEGWRLGFSLAPVVRVTENDFFVARSFGVRGALLPGYQGERWGLMAEVAYEQSLATHLSQSSLYRELSYPGARDGWYSLTGGTLQAGVRGGYRVGSVELSAAAGVLKTVKFGAVVPPFYATLGSSYAF